MARIALISTVITFIVFSTGCRLDTGSSHRMPPSTSTVYGPTPPIDLKNVTEADLAEQVALTRQEYLQAVQLLVSHYSRTGNNRKQDWAEKELRALKAMPMYDYLGDVIPGPDLSARMAIPAADALYSEAEIAYNDATRIPVWKKKNQFRVAMDKYKQVIKLYPRSDKIDDAAFFLGVIHEYFKDYDIAVKYYQRAYQWDAQTPHPARFKTASLFDKYLNEKDQAVDLYQKGILEEGTMHPGWRDYAEERVAELIGSEKK